MLIRTALVLLAFVALASGSIACSSGDKDEDEAPGLAHDVHVHLGEWSVRTQPTSIEGPATVNIGGHNHGEYPHQVTVVKSDLDPANLPITGVQVDIDAIGEPAAEFEVPAAEGDAGTQVASAELSVGKYVLYCAIPGHYQQGMYGALEVTAKQP